MLKSIIAGYKKLYPYERAVLKNAAIVMGCIIAAIITVILALLFPPQARADTVGEIWTVTAYCSCKKCCNKSDGITASGKPARAGYAACNWMPFGTRLNVEKIGTVVVMDRGARSLFGGPKNHIKHLDIWFASHIEARKFGVKKLKIERI